MISARSRAQQQPLPTRGRARGSAKAMQAQPIQRMSRAVESMSNVRIANERHMSHVASYRHRPTSYVLTQSPGRRNEWARLGISIRFAARDVRDFVAWPAGMRTGLRGGGSGRRCLRDFVVGDQDGGAPCTLRVIPPPYGRAPFFTCGCRAPRRPDLHARERKLKTRACHQGPGMPGPAPRR